ncbi:von Willebrand factor type A domain-containing protein [Clostridium cavendishii DSM 21758]|uniref:von Willebrand factor type A domain-containing protein n=1 Tax=Clostridium cavendishii DSM 21758 TaxID=1121302 RepID=A0A1M6CZ76_9CLOT|nr:VWA domain-containing protein [Clostridium cavendishii]SHI66307.1 von Willebrand factor type A domain-containing protein [Clostridium cavendishii DSM 21758]
MSIEVTRLYALLLLPLLIGFLYYTTRKYKVKNKKGKSVLITRIIIFLLLTLALCDISLKINLKENSTIYLLDLSDSAKEFKGEGEKLISEAIENSPRGDKSAVIAFGENTAVEQFLTKNRNFKDATAIPTKTATNIENALNTALGIFDNQGGKRIVLITDGEENEGDMIKAVPSLKEQNVALKVYKINKQKQDEVYVEDLKIPENINLGEEFSIVVKIQSNVKTSGKLSLFSGREKKGEQQVEIERGTNTFVFKDKQLSGGFKDYKVSLSADKDTETKNNEYIAYTNVRAKSKVLLIEGKPGDAGGLESLLKASYVDYKKITPISAPRSLNELNEYKAVITCNVHKEDLSKEFLDNIEPYVKDYAGGFIATGGEDAYALGEYKDTALEKILPVNMDMKGKKEIPEISIVMVIDHSGSMSAGDGISKLNLAKEAATKAIDNLRTTDDVGVIAFDDSYDFVVKMQKANDKNAIKKSIGSIGDGGGTSIYPALEEAYKAQKESKAKIKHIILLTDGQDEFHEYDDLVKKLNDDKITLSTVAVGEDSDRRMLGILAEDSKGRSYYTDTNTDIPRIFAKEIFLSTKVYLNNRTFVPKITGNHSVLKNVVEDGKMPNLFGYVGTSKKDKAINVLSSDEDDPILSLWQYGLGKTVAWTSDMSGKWSGEFLTWNKNLQLWRNIVDYAITNYDGDNSLKITQEGNYAKIEYTLKDGEKAGKVTGVYNSSQGEKGDFNLDEVEPGKYETKVKLKDFDFYNFNVRKEVNGSVESSKSSALAMQYSKEYKILQNNENLEGLVNDAEGSFIKSAEDIFKGKIKNEASKTNLTTLFTILAMLLFLIDVAYRRLNIDLSKVFKKLGLVKLKSKFRKRSEKQFELKKAKNKGKPTNENSKKIINKAKVNLESDNRQDSKEDSMKKESIEVNKEQKKIVKKESSKSKNTLDTKALLKKKQDRNGREV